MSLERAAPLLSELVAKYEAGDVVGGQETLNEIKLLLLDLDHPNNNNNNDPHLLQVAIQALELGVLMTVASGDLDAFSRNVAQLKPYYENPLCPTSARKCQVLGLNLMHLLVDNRLSEFHAELELLTEDEANNPLIRFPIQLERQLMVGIYDEVLNCNSQVPDESYIVFVNHLLQTVRDSIADCIEVSYSTMTLKDAQTMMKFASKQELLQYVQDCRDDWIINQETDTLCFQPPPSGSKASDIPSMTWIQQSLTYATEMERIV